MEKKNLASSLESIPIRISNSDPDYDSFDLTTQEGLAKIQRLFDDNKGRKNYAKWVAWVVSIWLLSVLLILTLNYCFFHLSDSVLIALLGTTTLNILGLPYIVLRGYFNVDKI